jgi:hypothetical protein
MKIGLASLIGLFSLSMTLTAGEGHFPEKVATEIDRLLDLQLKKDNIPASPPATDAEFLRRISLDLNGTIPSASRAREFLESTDPQKRPKLIEELLASPHYGRHFGIIWSNLVSCPVDSLVFVLLAFGPVSCTVIGRGGLASGRVCGLPPVSWPSSTSTTRP